MQTFPESYVVTYEVPLTLNDEPVTATAARAVVTDEKRRFIGNADVTLGEVAKIVVPAELNVLSAGATGFEGRVISVEIVTEAGTITRQIVYALQGVSDLSVPGNSFQTIPETRIKAFDIARLTMVPAVEDRELRSALIEAHSRIVRIALKIPDGDSLEAKRPITSFHTRYVHLDWTSWQEMTEEEFSDFPLYFLEAIKRAQIIEADEILTGDIIGEKRRAGILSETTGESSMMFRGGQLDMGLSRRALEALTGFVHYQSRVSR